MAIASVTDLTSLHAIVISDRPMFRKTFSKLLTVLEPAIQIEELSDGLTEKTTLPAAESGLVVLDAGGMDQNRVEDTVLFALELQPAAHVVLVLDEQDDALAEVAMCAGALGVMIKAAPPTVLIDMLQRALKGERFRPAPVISVDREALPEEMRRQLSARQQKLLRLMVGGQSISMTATELGLTPAKVVSEMRVVLGIVRGRSF